MLLAPFCEAAHGEALCQAAHMLLKAATDMVVREDGV